MDSLAFDDPENDPLKTDDNNIASIDLLKLLSRRNNYIKLKRKTMSSYCTKRKNKKKIDGQEKEDY